MKSQIKIKVGVTAWRETAPPAALNTSLPYTVSCQNEKKKVKPKAKTKQEVVQTSSVLSLSCLSKFLR